MSIINTENPVMLVDDEEYFLKGASFVLKSAGIENVVTCSESTKAMELIKKHNPSVIVLDIMMPNMSGHEVFEMIIKEGIEAPVIFLSAVNELETAVDLMKKGAFDYVLKPVDDSRFVNSVSKAVENLQLKNQNRLLKEYLINDELKNPQFFEEIITNDKKMKGIFKYVETISSTNQPVLITGDTGTGKELMAKAVHLSSLRKGEFVCVNTAGLDDHMFSDTLFGHEKGAFTGADVVRKGLIEKAAQGTLFLDEIGDMTPESQVKLLRLLQDKTYYPLGSDILKKSSARVVFATNRNLLEMVKDGKFRQDLYYRIKMHHVGIPPLKERKSDIKILLDHFLKEACDIYSLKGSPNYDKSVINMLMSYDFPGNIREFKSLVFDAVSRIGEGPLTTDAFTGISSDLNYQSRDEETDDLVLKSIFNKSSERFPTLKEAEDSFILYAFETAGNNVSFAAEILGLTRQALSYRLKKIKNGK